ncbi:MAG TPA: hypothetical protein PKE29_10665 [Phycisphaerales bacterium]|nr:hypothetical protein [Phycisphaerales bacterium]
MTRGRAIAWLLTLASAGVFGASIMPMVRRIEDYNASAGFLSLHAEPIGSRQIRVEGFPPATLTDDRMPDRSSAVRLDFGGASTLIPVRAPAGNLPNLSAYDEWLKVLAIYQVVRGPDGEQYRKDGSERLIIVVRRTPEGFDPDGMGEVRRIEWVFDFLELKKDGTVDRFVRRWPRSPRAEARLRREARGEEGDAATIASAKALAAIEPLKDRTLEHFAAMHVIPKLNMPQYKFNDTAFRIEVLGWTLPAAMGSALVFTGAVVFALAPRRRVRDGAAVGAPGR